MQSLFRSMWLAVAAALLSAGVAAEPVKVELQPSRVKQIHRFAPSQDGDPVFGRFVLGRDGRLYNVSDWGGPAGGGTVFRMSTHGQVKLLYGFGASGVTSPRNLMLGADGNFYGTALQPDLRMVLFRLTPHGKYTEVYSSPGGDDDCLLRGVSGLIQARDGDFLVVSEFGVGRDGCIVRVSPHGHAKLLHLFRGDDGLMPSSLVESNDGFFYGLTYVGGKFGQGTFFRMHPNGRVDVLHSFGWQRNGVSPRSLVEGPDGFFYGVTPVGGGTHAGTVFRASRDGEVSALHHFERQTDGKTPASLTLGRDGQLYGLTSELYHGKHLPTAFRLSLDGVFTVLHRLDDLDEDEHVATHGMTEAADGHFYWASLDSSGPSSVAYQLRLAP